MNAKANAPDLNQIGLDKAENDVAREVIRAISGISYGSVEIIIHDSKVVQIERKEKFRFAENGNSRKGVNRGS